MSVVGKTMVWVSSGSMDHLDGVLSTIREVNDGCFGLVAAKSGDPG